MPQPLVQTCNPPHPPGHPVRRAFTTLTTVGYGDIGGVTTAERIVCMWVQVIGTFYFGFVIGMRRVWPGNGLAPAAMAIALVGTSALRARDLQRGQVPLRKTETCPIRPIVGSKSRV